EFHDGREGESVGDHPHDRDQGWLGPGRLDAELGLREQLAPGEELRPASRYLVEVLRSALRFRGEVRQRRAVLGELSQAGRRRGALRSHQRYGSARLAVSAGCAGERRQNITEERLHRT